MGCIHECWECCRHLERLLSHPWMVTEIRRDAWGLEESKYHLCLQKWQEGEPWELLPSRQPHVHPWEGGGAPHSGGHPYPHGWHEGDQDSQHEPLKVNHACPAWLHSTVKQLPGWIEERAEAIVQLDFSKAFDSASDNTLTGCVDWISGLWCGWRGGWMPDPRGS